MPAGSPWLVPRNFRVLLAASSAVLLVFVHFQGAGRRHQQLSSGTGTGTGSVVGDDEFSSGRIGNKDGGGRKTSGLLIESPNFDDVIDDEDPADGGNGDADDGSSVPDTFSRCRRERLRTISEKLPGFDPAIDVNSWLWKPKPHLSEFKLPFGIDGVEEEIKQLASSLPYTGPRWSSLRDNLGQRDDKTSAKSANVSDVNGDAERTSPAVDGRGCGSRTCVVVGNSPALLLAAAGGAGGLGRTIDAHDVVVRFNDAPTSPPFSDRVGAKTSLRMFYPESSQLVANVSSTDDGEYMMTVFKPDDVRWLLLTDPGLSKEERARRFDQLKFWKTPEPPEKLIAIRDRLRVTNPEILSEAKQLARLEGIPTSGLYAIVMALHECSVPVSIAGFGYGRSPDEPMHYYDSRPVGDLLGPKNGGQHRIADERQFIDRLAKLGLVKDLMVNR